MDPSATPSDPSKPEPKAANTNGTVAGGAAGGGWTSQGLVPGAGMSVGGASAMASASKPAADIPKTRKKGLSVSTDL